MGIGLGPDSYAIIEQGRIGQVLSSKPSDRRAIIEEAAGITKFKTKKRLAEAKLESSKRNLSRVNDIYVEVEKQLASLKRQASQGAAVRGIARADARVAAAGAGEQGARTRRAKRSGWRARWAKWPRTKRSTRQSLREFEAEQERLDRRAYELDAERRQGRTHRTCALELDRAENRIVFNRQRGDGAATAREEQLAERTRASRRAGCGARCTRGRAGRASSPDCARKTARLEMLLAGLAERSAELAAIDADRRSAHRRAARQMQRMGRKHGPAARRAGAGGTSAGAPCRRARTAGTLRTAGAARNRCTIASART